MTTATAPLTPPATATPPAARADRPQTLWRQVLRSRRVVIGGGILAAIMLLCLATLPWTLREVAPDGSAVKTGETGVPFYTLSSEKRVRQEPTFFTRDAKGHITGLQHWWSWFGYDPLGRSIMARSLFGGTISLSVGLAAATISVLLGVAVGLFAGYRGGWVDSALMRFVDIMYGLPYILLVILFKIAFEQPLTQGLSLVALLGTIALLAAGVTLASAIGRRGADLAVPLVGAGLLAAVGIGLILARHALPRPVLLVMGPQAANLVVLFAAIGLVSWLTMARVVRGQVLSLRGLPYIEACRALGLKERRVFLRHILPNLVGPITVYATLTVPSAILQESFLSFLGVGVNPPLATWGSLASEGVEQLSPLRFYWWLLVFPCALLAVTLLSLNFLGDGLRDVFDPKKEAAKI
jgi:ABC-type dipeptide/oligopeptide/nickel transport system permease subunit